MNKDSTFDRLIVNLSKNDRKDLLKKVRQNIPISSEPLSIIDDDIEIPDITRKYNSLSIFQKILITLKSIFLSKGKTKLLEELFLHKLAVKIDKESPGLLSFKSEEFLPRFYSKTLALKENIKIFQKPLMKILHSEKSEFIAFLGGIQLPDIQERILSEAEPEKIAIEGLLETDHEIKKESEKRVDEIINSINDAERNHMYKHMNTLKVLNNLVFFHFEKILSKFQSKGKIGACKFITIKEQFKNLTNIMCGLVDSPESILLEAIFLYQQQSVTEVETASLEDIILQMLSDAEKRLSVIRNYNKEVNLLLLTRYITKNFEYTPENTGGGEDWFLLYRQYWENRIERQFIIFKKERAMNRLINEVSVFTKTANISFLDFYKKGILDDEVVIKYELSLAFISTFVNQFFTSEIIGLLELILIKGEFYKEQNKQDYSDSYNDLIRIKDQIAEFNKKLSPVGEIGEEIKVIEKEMIGNKLIVKRINNIYEGVNSEAGFLVIKMLNTILLLDSVLNGILFGKSGGKYDTLSNLGQLGNNENQNLLIKLGEIQMLLHNANKLLNEIYETELTN